MKFLLFSGCLVMVILEMCFRFWAPRPSQSETLLYEQCLERGGLPQFSAWGYTVGCVGFRPAK